MGAALGGARPHSYVPVLSSHPSPDFHPPPPDLPVPIQLASQGTAICSQEPPTLKQHLGDPQSYGKAIGSSPESQPLLALRQSPLPRMGTFTYKTLPG